MGDQASHSLERPRVAVRALVAAASLVSWLALATRLSPSAAAATAGAATVPAVAAPAPPLAFRIDEGDESNLFLREGEVAAHLVLRSGAQPRILVAFPAGDSGVALWFAKTDRPVAWDVEGPLRAVALADAKGRALHGIEAELTADAPALRIKQAVLSSVRVIRDYVQRGTVPVEVRVAPVVSGNTISWTRDRLDGAPGYRLQIEALDGGTVTAQLIRARPGGRLHLRILALTGERPLSALAGASLLAPTARPDVRERHVLEFLSYREKFLAGSWRFDTYFGRDTLLSLALLAPVLQPQAMESGLCSVLVRLAPDGEVAHEEAIGEFAILESLEEGSGPSVKPRYDYSMIDESFLLAPTVARWMLDTPVGRAHAADFLASLNGTGERAGHALVRNLIWVVGRTARFAGRPVFENLVGLKAGRRAGDWRDSRNGLGGGRYPYDVNAVFVPVALGATYRLARSGLLDPYLTPAERITLLRAGSQRDVWSERAPALFVTTVSAARARVDVSSYARTAGVDAASGIASLDRRPVAFYALSLDAAGRPIPVMHSDVAFALLFEAPPPRALERMLAAVARPFPAGLLTPVGLLVANPAFADRDLQSRFGRTAYHGTVIWSWQQAVLAAGLERQLSRSDLSAALRRRLSSARERLRSAIRVTSRLRASELWSWSFAEGRYRAEPFGQGTSGGTEADAAQLWSTVYLALQ